MLNVIWALWLQLIVAQNLYLFKNILIIIIWNGIVRIIYGHNNLFSIFSAQWAELPALLVNPSPTIYNNSCPRTWLPTWAMENAFILFYSMHNSTYIIMAYIHEY